MVIELRRSWFVKTNATLRTVTADMTITTKSFEGPSTMIVSMDDEIVYQDRWYCWKNGVGGWSAVYADFYDEHDQHFQVRLSNPSVFSKMKLFVDGDLVTERSEQIGPINILEKGKKICGAAAGYIRKKIKKYN